MSRYILRRLLLVPPLLLGVAAITYALVNLTPGSPADAFAPEGQRLSPEQRATIERAIGLDRPVHIQFVGWLGDVLQGNLGVSLVSFRPVSELIRERLPNTLLLSGASVLVALALAIPLGVRAAVRRNGPLDQTVVFLSTVLQGLPSFWFAILLVLLFAVQFSVWGLPSLPLSGSQSILDGGGFLDRLRHLILPVIALGLPQAAGYVLYVRNQILEALSAEHVQVARAKGLPERRVVTWHVLRNALAPLTAFLAFIIPGLFAGAAIIETIFGYPGIGELTVRSAQQKDYTVIMGTVLLSSVVTILAALIADVAQAVVDPRVRLGERAR